MNSIGLSLFLRNSSVTTPHTALPYPPNVEARALTTREAQLVEHLVRLQLVSSSAPKIDSPLNVTNHPLDLSGKQFLATAPSAWVPHQTITEGGVSLLSSSYPQLRSNRTAMTLLSVC